MDRDRSERSRSIPLAKPVSRSLKMKDVGSLLLNNCVSCFSHCNLNSLTSCFEQTIPRYLPNDFESNDEKNILITDFSREINRL